MTETKGNGSLAARLAALNQAATEGPWKRYRDGIAAGTGEGWADFVCEEMGQPNRSDAALIVELRNALPALLTLIEEASVLGSLRTPGSVRQSDLRGIRAALAPFTEETSR